MRFRKLGAALALAAAAALAVSPAMADNYDVRDGNGAHQTMAAKLVSTVLHPLHLLEVLVSGTPTAVSAGQATKANSIPVVLPSDPDVRTAAVNLTAADVGSSTVAGQNGVTLVSGTPTANSTATWTVNGHASITIGVSGTFVETAQVEASADCVTYAPASAKVLGSGLVTGSVTAPGIFRVDANGMACVRLRATAYTSGTLAALANASAASGLNQVLNPVRLSDAAGAVAGVSGNPLIVQQTAALPAGAAILGKIGIDQTTPGATNGVQVNAALPSGSNVVGKFGIDQTTPGTTNGVQVNAALPAGSNLIGKVAIDQTTPGATNGVQVTGALPAGANTIGHVVTDAGSTANVGGYGFQLAPSVTVQAAGYVAGNSEGGLITLTGAARTNGGSGTLQNVRITSAGGATNTIAVYAWSKAPASTCADKAAFVRSATDTPYAIPGFPISITLSAGSAGDTATYGQLTGLAAQFKNQDASPGSAIYLCLVTQGNVTPASTADLAVGASGFQD